MQGDTRAFGRLVSMHQSAVRGFALRLCHDPALADDLAQEAFLQAYRKLASFQGSGSFASWVLGIAYRCFLQHKRRDKLAGEVLHLMEQRDAELALFYEHISPAQLDLERALHALNPNEAAAISLNMSLGYSHAEVAAIMDMPLGSIKSHISRGMAKLRELLNAEDAS